MKKEEIVENLCFYDLRNPDGANDQETINCHKKSLLRDSRRLGYEVTCSCDNCFYGRTKLSEELLKYLK